MITFTENNIVQKFGDQEKIWNPAALLETYQPLQGEPLSARNEAMKQVLNLAEQAYDQLSERAERCYRFWKQLIPQRIEEQVYEYTVTISKTYRWILTVTSQGLFYKDVDAMYSQAKGMVHEQLFSDFWFYGPLMPVPELDTRKWVTAQIRNAFLQVGPVSRQHFELFEYPALEIDRHWQEGDDSMQYFVNMRRFGIEYGKTTWYDGLVYVGFLSFERFLADPNAEAHHISADIRAAIREHLSEKKIDVPREATSYEHLAEMKRMFMENSGMHQYIYREYGKGYQPPLLAEQAWRQELVEQYTRQLQTEDSVSVIHHLATALRYHGVHDIEDQLLQIARTATPKARQAIAKVLGELFNNDSGVEILLSLLEFGDQDSYWQNYVFQSLYRMRQNRAVQQFILQCLEGDHELYFRKAVEVLQMWGYFGDKALTDKSLLSGLNWADATAGDPAFRDALTRVVRILHS